MAKKENKEEEDSQASEPEDSNQVDESSETAEKPVVEEAQAEIVGEADDDKGETGDAKAEETPKENDPEESGAGESDGSQTETSEEVAAMGDDTAGSNESVDTGDIDEESSAPVVEKATKKKAAAKKKDKPEEKAKKSPTEKPEKKKSSKKAKTVTKEDIKSLSVIDSSGSSVDDIALNEVWLEREKGSDAVHASVVAFLAGERSGSASTKTRSQVRGGGAKPWRQKGTGRARAGSSRSPIWRGGGVTFGPSPRDYSKKVNKKVRQLALRRAFTSRIDDGDVIVVDVFNIEEPKTKLVVSMLNGIGAGEDALLVIENSDNINAILGAGNLPHVGILHPGGVNVYQLLLFRKVVFTRKAFEAFADRLS